MNKKTTHNSSDTILEEDIKNILSSLPFSLQMHKSSILVTGATGLLGSQLVKVLAEWNHLHNLNMTIILLVRNKEKAVNIFGTLLERNDIILHLGDINDPIHIQENVDFIIHGASATSSRYFVSNPVETITTAITGTKNILEFARKKQIKSMVYLSSLEVYGTPSTNALIQEHDYGSIDPLNVRSSYSEGKRMAECLCISYAHEYHVPVKIARLSQTFGAGVTYDDGRVFAEFARCVVEKRDIILRTEGRTIRSYCYTADAITAMFYILLNGVCGEAYNVTNMDTAISIRAMAELVCDTFPQANINVKVEIPDDIQSYGYNPEMIIRLNSEKLQNLGWKASVGLAEMFQRLIASWNCRYPL